MELELLSVNIGTPRVIGTRDGKPLYSAIAKEKVAGEAIFAGKLGLAGDEQANKIAHGGIDKAVYAYSADNWPWWEGEKNFACAPARFGENLTLRGAGEDAVRIGDRFAWGEAVLEISQPRAPCNKFQIYSGRTDVPAAMTLSGRCGWYLRVIEEGTVPIAGVMTRIRESDGPSVRAIFLAAFDRRMDAEKRKAMAAYPALAEAWRARFS